jgi:hypothetical protein
MPIIDITTKALDLTSDCKNANPVKLPVANNTVFLGEFIDSFFMR